MAEEQAALTAEVLATWFTPLEAVAYAARIIGSDQAAAAIWERLKGGLIRAVATTSAATLRGRPPVAKTIPSFIPGSHWDHFSGPTEANFWQTGDARFFIPPNEVRGLSLTVRCFGIKLDPADVRGTLPPPPPQQPKQVGEIVSTIEDDRTEALSVARGPPVSEELLNRWYDLYCRAYQGSADTLDNALNSARGMFPGKFVSRERVRKLCAGRKRGRKSRDQIG